MVPTEEVEGTGADATPVPPEATVYHFNAVPVAVNAPTVVPKQYSTLVVNGRSVSYTVTVITSLGPSQPFNV